MNLSADLMMLRRDILSMGAAVEHRVSRAIAALAEGDIEAAQEVRRSDDEIDVMENKVEGECLRVLALMHPVAGDLRFILSVLRINADLERIGDHARSISKRVIDLNQAGRLPLPPALLEMAERARTMLGDSLAALANGDVRLSREVRTADRRVDDLQKEVFAWVHQEIPRHVDWTQSAIDVLSMARAFERIADIATNIAEDVIFIYEGLVVRHSKK